MSLKSCGKCSRLKVNLATAALFPICLLVVTALLWVNGDHNATLETVFYYQSIPRSNEAKERTLQPNETKNEMLQHKTETEILQHETKTQILQRDRTKIEMPQHETKTQMLQRKAITTQTLQAKRNKEENKPSENRGLTKAEEIHKKKSVALQNSECKPWAAHSNITKVDQQDCSAPYVLMNHGGRLGNKLCQYTSLYLLRHVYGIRIAISKAMNKALSAYFKNISLPIEEDKCFSRDKKRILYSNMLKLLDSRATEKAGLNSSSSSNNNSAKGLLRGESYYIYNNPCPLDLIVPHRDLVKEFLVFRDDIISKARTSVEQALKSLGKSINDSTLVTVHVRRTDYIHYIASHYKLTPLDRTYFQNAFEYYRNRTKNPVFVVLSDDPKWCRKVLAGKDVVIAASRVPAVDMAVLSLGQHHISSYGTYGFMGNILGRGTIVYPESENQLYSLYKCVLDKDFQPIQRNQ